MLSVLEPTFLLLIVIAHPPMNAFGGTTPEDATASELSEPVKKWENRIELGSLSVVFEPKQPEFHNNLFSGRSMGENNSPNFDENFNCIGNCHSEDESCSTATLRKESKDGVYLLKGPIPDSKPFYVYCQHETESETAWTVIQRRLEGSMSFNRTSLDFKLGFGDLNEEYWIGLERLHQITNSQPHELLIVLYDFEIEKAYVKFWKFVVGSEDKNYELTVGNEEEIPPEPFLYHKSRRFYETESDTLGGERALDCSRNYAGILDDGFYEQCLDSRYYKLNGVYYSSSTKNPDEIKWNDSLHKVVMAIRPKEV